MKFGPWGINAFPDSRESIYGSFKLAASLEFQCLRPLKINHGSKLSAAELLLKGESYWNPTCFGFKKVWNQKEQGTRWPSKQDDHISTGYIGYLDWKFMRCFNISEMINDNVYQTFIPLLFGCFFWPVLGIEDRHLAANYLRKKDFGQFVGNKFIMPRRKAWIQTGDFSLRLNFLNVPRRWYLQPCWAGRTRF